MYYHYDMESDTTRIRLNDEEIGEISGKVTRWKNGIPHPDTDNFDEFETIIRQLSTPDERIVFLHLTVGKIKRSGFDPS